MDAGGQSVGVYVGEPDLRRARCGVPGVVGALPPIERAALLLDLDGTLLDIAPTPDAVVVPSELPDVLRTLRRLLGDAVAVVTGRPVETIDRLFGDAVFAVAGEHG